MFCYMKNLCGFTWLEKICHLSFKYLSLATSNKGLKIENILKFEIFSLIIPT